MTPELIEKAKWKVLDNTNDFDDMYRKECAIDLFIIALQQVKE